MDNSPECPSKERASKTDRHEMENDKNKPEPTDRGQSKWIRFLGSALFCIGVIHLTGDSHHTATGIILIICSMTTLRRVREAKQQNPEQ